MRLTENPLEAWSNDDLLLQDASRYRLGLKYGKALQVLAWDELCTVFLDHDRQAIEARRRSQGFGFQAVGAGAARRMESVLRVSFPGVVQGPFLARCRS